MIVMLVLTILFGIASIVVPIALILEWPTRVWERLKHRKIVSFKGVAKGIDKITDGVTRSDFDPAYIVGLDGGGYVISALLSETLNKPMVPLPVIRNVVGGKVREAHVDQITLNNISYIENKSVLLVDDVSTGGTLRDVMRKLEETFALEIKIAVLVRPKDSELEADSSVVTKEFYDFWGYECKLRGDPKNVELPWNVDPMGIRKA